MPNKARIAASLVMAVSAASAASTAYSAQPSGRMTVDQAAKGLVQGDSSDLFKLALSKAPTDITSGLFASEGGDPGGSYA